VKKLRATTVVFLMAAVAVQADVVITDFNDEAERDSFLSTAMVVAYEEFRTGGGSGQELLGGAGDDDLSITADLEWSRNNEHGFTLNYDGAGNLNLTITPPSSTPTTISFQPTSWFNYLAFSIESNNFAITGLEMKNISIDFQSNVTPVRTLDAPGDNGWDGILFEFEGNGPGNVEEFTITGVFTPSSPTGFSGGDQFKGEFYLAQVEEPGPSSVSVTPISTSEFQEKFNYATSSPVSGQNVIAYEQIQAGETTSIQDILQRWELESGVSSATDFGHTTWESGEAYTFTSIIDGNSNLNTVFNGVSSGDGVPIAQAINEVWIEARIASAGFSAESIEITNQLFDGVSLPDLIVTGYTPDNPVSVAFKIHDNSRLNNLGESSYSADVLTNVLQSASEEDWTFTKLYVYNPDLEVEVTSIELGSFTYDHSSGNASVTLQAAPSAAYLLKQSTDPGDFTSATTITPTAVTTGTLDGNQITTDTTGKAVIQFNLGTAPRMFVKAERP
jgi:hypothetical protein